MGKTCFNMKTMNITELEELADFYFIEISELFDDAGELVIPEKTPFGFSPNDVHHDDYKAICQFGRIVKNYQKKMYINKTN